MVTMVDNFGSLPTATPKPYFSVNWDQVCLRGELRGLNVQEIRQSAKPGNELWLVNTNHLTLFSFDRNSFF